MRVSALFLVVFASLCSFSFSSGMLTERERLLALLAAGEDVQALDSFRTAQGSLLGLSDDHFLCAGFVYVKQLYRQWSRMLVPDFISAPYIDEHDAYQLAHAIVMSFVTEYPVGPVHGRSASSGQSGALSEYIFRELESFVSDLVTNVPYLSIAKAEAQNAFAVQRLLHIYSEFTSAVGFVFRDPVYVRRLVVAGAEAWRSLHNEFSEILTVLNAVQGGAMSRDLKSTTDAYIEFPEYQFLLEFKQYLESISRLVDSTSEDEGSSHFIDPVTKLKSHSESAMSNSGSAMSNSESIMRNEWIRFFLVYGGELSGGSLYVGWVSRTFGKGETCPKADVEVLLVLLKRYELQKHVVSLKLRVGTILKQIARVMAALESPEKLLSSEAKLRDAHYDNMDKELSESLANVDVALQGVLRVLNGDDGVCEPLGEMTVPAADQEHDMNQEQAIDQGQAIDQEALRLGREYVSRREKMRGFEIASCPGGDQWRIRIGERETESCPERLLSGRTEQRETGEQLAELDTAWDESQVIYETRLSEAGEASGRISPLSRGSSGVIEPIRFLTDEISSERQWLKSQLHFMANTALLSVRDLLAEVEEQCENADQETKTDQEARKPQEKESAQHGMNAVQGVSTEPVSVSVSVQDKPRDDSASASAEHARGQASSEARETGTTNEENALLTRDSKVQESLQEEIHYCLYLTRPSGVCSVKLSNRLFALREYLQQLLVFHARSMADFVFRLGHEVEPVATRILMSRGVVFDGRFASGSSDGGDAD